MKRFTILSLILAMAATACGTDAATGDGQGSTSSTTTSTTTPSNDPPRLVLRIDEEGGFAPVEFSLNRIPRFSLYSDGSLYYQGPVPDIFPGPALPNIQIAAAGDAAIEDALEVVAAMGLAQIDEEFNNDAAANVADATSTVVTYFDEAGAHRYGVYALGFVDIADPNARNLMNLLNLLDTYSAQSPSTPYTADRLQLLVAEALNLDPQFATVEPWAFDFDPTTLTPQVLDYACTVIEGTESDAAYTTFGAANQSTVWETETSVWRILPRPLLPDEEACVFGA